MLAFAFAPADLSRRLVAVELGHLAVHQHGGVARPLDRLDRRATVVGHLRAVAAAVEQADREQLVDRAVLGDEHERRVVGQLARRVARARRPSASGRARPAGRRCPRRRAAAPRTRRCCPARARSGRRSPRPSSRPAVPRSSSPRPVPPYLRAVELSAWLKGWKRRVERVRVDADAGVGDLHAHDASRRAAALPLTATATRPLSVNLTAFETRLITTWRSRAASPRSHAGSSGSTTHVELEALVAGRHEQRRAALGDRLAQREVGRLELDLAGLHLRVVEDVVDHQQQALAGGADDLRVFALLRASARCRAAARSCRSRRSAACAARG